MEKHELLTKKFMHPDLWMAIESISQVLEIEPIEIFERKRPIKNVKARYFLINFSLQYTANDTGSTANFLSPAIKSHSSVSCGRKKIQYDIDNYETIRNQWIQVLQNYKSKLQANENHTNDITVNRINMHIDRFMENAGQKRIIK